MAEKFPSFKASAGSVRALRANGVLAATVAAIRRAARGKRRGVLVYLGLHRGLSFSKLFTHYDSCYAFEANPELFEELQQRYARYPHVRLINAAVAESDGDIEFNISSNNGASSSLGQFDERWENFKAGQIQMMKTIRVRGINLQSFCHNQGISYIDDYVSDIQGMDLAVLKTMKPFIESRRIGTITSEVSKDSRRNIYANLPDNCESGFRELLGAHYDLVATGWGSLKDGQMESVPDDWWEMDCKWRAKSESESNSREG